MYSFGHMGCQNGNPGHKASRQAISSSSQEIRYIFLDRDGVINRKPKEGEYVSGWNKFQILTGVESAIAALNRSGRHVLVVTNQRGVALGLYTRGDVENLHQRLQEYLEPFGAQIAGFYYCPHDKNQCDCRKPNTGMFQKAFRDFSGASPENSIMIGDSLSDIEAAEACGMQSIFISGDPATRKPGAERAIAMANWNASSLAEAVDRLLRDDL